MYVERPLRPFGGGWDSFNERPFMSIWSAMVIVIFVLLAKINNKLKSHGMTPVWQNKDLARR